MRKHFRHSLGNFSAILIVLVGIFLALPHGICLGNVVTAEACPCAPAAEAGDSCCCCSGPAKSLGCGDHGSDSTGEESHGTSESGAVCLSISSDSSHSTGAERVPAPSVIQAVVAILPPPVEITVGQPTVFPAFGDTALWRDDGRLHQDNCVYII